MSVEFVRTLTAVAALAANGFTVALVIGLVAVRHSTTARTIVAQIGESAFFLGALVATACVAGSLYYSEIAHFIPCRFCWYQRIAMYPLAVILWVGVVTRDINVRRSAVVLAAGGVGLSTYHYLLQRGVIESSGSCDPIAPCSAAYVWELDFISIPYMALSGFLLLLALLASSWVAPPAVPMEDDMSDREPDTIDDALNVPSTSVEELLT